MESLRWGDLGRSQMILMEGWQLKGSETGELSHRDKLIFPETFPIHITVITF